MFAFVQQTSHVDTELLLSAAEIVSTGEVKIADLQIAVHLDKARRAALTCWHAAQALCLAIPFLRQSGIR